MKDLELMEPSELSSEISQEIRDIYIGSFPSEQRVDFQKLLDAVKAKTSRLFVSIVGRSLVGFATITPLIGTDAILLEYMAVKSGLRNKGIGRTILRRLVEAIGSGSKASGIIFEAEPETEGVSRKAILGRRRIEFYKINGARIIERAPMYKMPNLKTRGAIRMTLMWIPLDNSTGQPDAQTLREYIKRIYVQAYERSLDDQLLVETLNSVVC